MALTAIQTALQTDLATQTATVTINGVATAIKDVPKTQDNAFVVAVWYNLATNPAFTVWRDLPMDTVEQLIAYQNMTPLDAVPTVTALPSNPTSAQTSTYNNEIAALHVWQARALACQGKQFNLQNLKIGRTTAPMKRSGYRASLQDCLTNLPAGASGSLIAANWVGVRDGAKFTATNAEKLLATGTGTFASPADLGFEGSVTNTDIATAWGLM